MRPIEGFEGIYSVTEDGKVFSHRRNKFLAPKQNHQKNTNKQLNYAQVVLCKDAVQKILYVHRLVAAAYVPNPDNKSQVNHIDGKRAHNFATNLEWVTAKENVAHAIAEGLIVPNSSRNKGTKHGRSKFTESDIRYIRANYKARDPEFGLSALAKKFSVAHPTILAVLGKSKKKTYLDVV